MRQILSTATIFLSVLTGFAQQTIPLTNWKLKTGDSPEWAQPGFDDSAWRPVQTDKKWEDEGYPDYDGYGWYRVKFFLPSSLKQNTGSDSIRFQLGKIDDLEQTFLNGMLLGQNAQTVPVAKAGSVPSLAGSGSIATFTLTRDYTVSVNDPRLLWDKENVLAVRVLDNAGGGGMYSGLTTVRMSNIADYLGFDMNSNPLATKPGGTVSKTLLIRNQNPSKQVEGTLILLLTDCFSGKAISRQTRPVSFKGLETSFAFNFKTNLAAPLKADYTFTEKGTGISLSGFWEFPCNNPGGGNVQAKAVPFTGVKVNDVFWTPWMERSRDKIIPHIFNCCEGSGRIDNIAKAAKKMKSSVNGNDYDESDVYKSIEAAAYSLRLYPDKKLEAYVDSIINLVTEVQLPDGYLDVYFILKGLDQRWTNDIASESYCAGHLIEAAVAWYETTGKRKFLDVAIRLANHIDSIFGPGKRILVTQHPELELALVKLYHVTNEPRYLRLSEYLLNQRGNPEGRELGGSYGCDNLPVRELNQAEGHVVRAHYMHCGMADVAMATGDKAMVASLDKVWDDMIPAKTFVTGGSGVLSPSESFGLPYQLPNIGPMVEGCGTVAFLFLAQRMSEIHADARYMDAAERVLYNRLAAEVSFDGKSFFYGCPLEAHSPRGWDNGNALGFDANGKLHAPDEKNTYRSAFFNTACCPPNIARFLPTIGGYVYAQNASTVFVNLYVGGTASLMQSGTNLTIEQSGNYPWEGNVKIVLSPEKPTTFDLALRIPSWCEGITFKVNGKPAETKIDKGYACIDRTWQAGDVVEINMPMPIKRVYADPRVAADRGRVALQRGPIVYCLEGVDHGGKVLDIILPKDAKLTAEKRPDLLGGVTVIIGTAKRVNNGQPAEEVKITAIPFYAWDNRPPSGEMEVWIMEDPAVINNNQTK